MWDGQGWSSQSKEILSWAATHRTLKPPCQHGRWAAGHGYHFQTLVTQPLEDVVATNVRQQSANTGEEFFQKKKVSAALLSEVHIATHRGPCRKNTSGIFVSSENVNHHISERMNRFTRTSKLCQATLDLSQWLRPICWCAQARHRGAEQKGKSNPFANTRWFWGSGVGGSWRRRRSKPHRCTWLAANTTPPVATMGLRVDSWRVADPVADGRRRRGGTMRANTCTLTESSGGMN